MLKKSILGLLVSIVSLNSFTLSMNSDIRVNAVAVGGCSLSAQDIPFGIVSVAQSKEGNITQTGFVNLQCSKNTTVYLSQDNGFAKSHDNKLYLNGQVNSVEGEFFEYKLLQPAVYPSQVTGVIKTPSYQDHTIGDDAAHELILTINTSDAFILNLRGIIEQNTITTKLKAGNYSDTVTYSVRF